MSGRRYLVRGDQQERSELEEKIDLLFFREEEEVGEQVESGGRGLKERSARTMSSFTRVVS